MPGTEWLEQNLREQVTAFAAAVDGVDPGARVPACPDWQVRDLVGHVGEGLRWAAGIVRTSQVTAPPDARDTDPGSPEKWSDWLREGAAELIGAIEDIGAGTTVWTVVGPRPSAFWLRRILHEITVHHADAALVADEPYEIPPSLAVDTIDEGLELLSALGVPTLPDGRRVQLRPDGPSVEGWLITHTPGGFTWERGTAEADLVVTGRTQDLVLVFSGRLRPEDGRIAVTGDRALLDHWLSLAP